MSKLDIVTGRMSKLMLRRWPMLAEQCPKDGCHAPLMRNPETGESKCVWHDAHELFPDELTEEEVQDKISETAEASVGESEEVEEPIDTEKERMLKERRAQSDLASELIGKKMLEGWAMMDKMCPNESCRAVPLVKDREEVQYCVICERRYMDEAAYKKRYGSIPDAGPSKPAAPSRAPVAAAPAAAAEITEKKAPAKADSTAVQKRSEPRDVAPIDADSISVAVKALEDKVVSLSQQLSTTTHYKDVERIAKAISACAKAIKACRDL
ncbi:hypothetical protein DL89DRAFT_22562 [Linderina pennispora]|uniref:Uncharacterized protein n=1 Tax=Linderina pennispora TaxID=61395 RepID=A0A1Y1WNQ7_9FUNG|nr:uncharacterized protein DL89DRAFT_22562 [Linderina pennispora]ORX74764.1 hypothetical protein DL89DRAFT_22562 [Linderina pennispora]